MELRELRYFRAIAQFGALSKAALHLRVAQPALSRQIANLEHELGVQLFNRNSRGVTLTDAGKVLLERTIHLESELEITRRAVSSFAFAVTGTLRVGVQAPLACLFIPEIAKTYRDRFPEVALQFVECSGAEIMDRLLNQQVEVGVFDAQRHHHSDLVSHPLWAEGLELLGPASAAETPTFRTGTVSVNEVAGLPLILPGTHTSLRRLVDDAFARHHRKVTPVVEAGAFSMVAPMVLAGLGFSIMPPSVSRPMVSNGELVAAQIDPLVRWTVSAVSRSAVTSDRTVAPFINMLKEAVLRLSLGSCTSIAA